MRAAVRTGVGLLLAGRLLGTGGPAHAGGGWIRPAGGAYAKIGLTSVNTNKYYTLAGQEITTNRFTQQVASLYAEVGLGHHLEAVLSFPAYRRARFSASTATQGIGDAQLGLRYGVLRGAWPLAVSVTAELPTGNPDARGTNTSNSQIAIALPTGDGEFNIWTHAVLSHSFFEQLYGTVDAGFNARTKGFTNQYSYSAQVGYLLLRKVWLTGTVRTLANVQTPRSGRLASIGIGEGVAYSTAALGANYAATDHLWFTADWATGFGKLRNVYAGSQFTVGVAWEWK
ncbi:hypothetical protein [Hymenobacter psychrophilus]|uniref:MetA-pathway of phenol degradation n=1 Tax=Hymenobacter psychrophilus TaxID=651662 RepID=A0A1H3D099_9BACT|nr:hypothetical protein [Hymenobacter psychrophilus]SDX59204.1 hypothetical protein SAMN04488069_102160 [Hymenobacter psychrophilus]